MDSNYSLARYYLFKPVYDIVLRYKRQTDKGQQQYTKSFHNNKKERSSGVRRPNS